MAQAPPTANRFKGGSKAVPGSSKTAPRGGSRVAKELPPEASERTLAGRILRDIRQSSHDLSKRADRLLRRVS